MLKDDLIWVYTTDADGDPVHITNKQHTSKDNLQPADGPLYIANMCIDQEPLQALAAITAATASASDKIHKITSMVISSQIRVYRLDQILITLTKNFSLLLPNVPTRKEWKSGEENTCREKGKEISRQKGRRSWRTKKHGGIKRPFVETSTIRGNGKDPTKTVYLCHTRKDQLYLLLLQTGSSGRGRDESY
jgi:hypothetical protein